MRVGNSIPPQWDTASQYSNAIPDPPVSIQGSRWNPLCEHFLQSRRWDKLGFFVFVHFRNVANRSAGVVDREDSGAPSGRFVQLLQS